MKTTQAPLLEMKDIDKAFPGVQALSKAQLTLRAGTVHSLMGENGAGKSTLMKCLFGIYNKDAGEIRMDGKKVDFRDPRDALDNGVAMVHQELNQVLRRNIMENIWLGRVPLKWGLVDTDKMYRDTKAIFDELHMDIDPKAIIGSLSDDRLGVDIHVQLIKNGYRPQGDHRQPLRLQPPDDRDRQGRLLQRPHRGAGRAHLLADGKRGDPFISDYPPPDPARRWHHLYFPQDG